MLRSILVPVLLFILSSLLCLMTFFAVYASLAVGLSLCATALIMAQRGAVPEQNRRLFRLALTLPSMRAGIALLLAPTVTVALATALMAGMFSA